MKVQVVSYSRSGNNDLLAREVARQLGAGHHALKEQKERGIGGMALDMILGRRPALKDLPGPPEDADLVLIMGPVWMFRVPAPLRTFMHAWKGKVGRYAWASLSGGALGPNTGLQKDLYRRMGKGLAFCLDLQIAGFGMAAGSGAAAAEDTGNWKLEDHPRVRENLADLVVRAVRALPEPPACS